MESTNGVRSRFLTLNTIKGTQPIPLYYVQAQQGVSVYLQEQLLGQISMNTGCTFLRLWQIDINKDGTNEILFESLCDRTHLRYSFLDLSLREITPAVKYRPTLTVVNYEEFEVIPQGEKPPVIRFLGLGFLTPPTSPWESPVTSKAAHLYELQPVLRENEWHYDPVVLENTSQWVKDLGLRYLPAYQVMHLIKGQLLVKLGARSVWVDSSTQKARWANLDDLLLLGDQRQQLWGTNESILQGFITPYDYRGYVLANGLRLRFQQTDRFDPLMDILGTQKNALGYLSVLRSFQNLIYLQYDSAGKLISKRHTVVDRFDFLSAEDLMATVVNLPTATDMLQMVDGTKVNTNYVDIIKAGVSRSYAIPDQCVTQTPALLDGQSVLPIFCAIDRASFEMRFIAL